MKKIISLVLLGCLLSGCFLRPHKMDIVQGNVFTQEEVSKLKLGMTEGQVKDIMGTPVLINIFTPNRVEYVYTFQPGYQPRQEKRVSCIFESGRLRDIKQS